MNRFSRLSKLSLIRNLHLLVADFLLIPAVIGISFLLRLNASDLGPYVSTILVFAILSAFAKPVVFFFFGLYRHYWRYASTNELISVVLATLAGTVVATLLMYFVTSLADFRPLPYAIPFLDWLLSTFLIGGIRLSVRLLANIKAELHGNYRPAGHPRSERHVLVMGAGDAGAMIVREMQSNPSLGFVPVGLLDDNRAKLGMVIHGVPVRGTREDISRLVWEEPIDEVIIAMPTAPGQAIRDVVTICQAAGVGCRTIPGICELISGQVSVTQVREVHIEDLLRRRPVRIEGNEAEGYLKDAVVLVTGAGGSIGSELCRQIACYHPSQLLLLGHGENSIYRILLDLRERFPHLAIQPLIADARDAERLREVFDRYRPEVVFHAAAHKHVPLMECNVAEAVVNNVCGTRCLLQAAEVLGTERFVLISTDKAVNPTCVMGATKRLSELLIQDAARRTGRVYAAVRFGNVLGSRGSVVPLFQRQIAAGGPVTVTHPKVRRYFMTISEAVQLVIQAGAIGQGGEIFVLDMGEPIGIVDLAVDLIRLCGLEPERDIKIAFTGLRPGEKLDEKLFADSEEPCPTCHDKILVARGGSIWNTERLARHLQELEALAKTGDDVRIRSKMQEISPEYQPVSMQMEAFRHAFVHIGDWEE